MIVWEALAIMEEHAQTALPHTLAPVLPDLLERIVK